MPGQRTRTLTERFWEKVDRRRPDECWPWTAAVTENGYGAINAGGRGTRLLAHRVSAREAGMEIDGKVVRHTCDNPPCCNPAHLLVGTQKDNVADMYLRGRSGVAGSRSHLAKLTEEQVAEILGLSSLGISSYRLAKIFGVTRTNVSTILHRRSWKHVTPADLDGLLEKYAMVCPQANTAISERVFA